MAPAAVFTAAFIGAAVGGASAIITGGNVGKGMLIGGLIGGATSGIGSVISGGAETASAAGAASGTTAGGAASGPLGSLGTNLGANVAESGIVGISANVPANAPQVFGNMKSAGLLGGAGGSSGSIAGATAGSVAEKVTRGTDRFGPSDLLRDTQGSTRSAADGSAGNVVRDGVNEGSRNMVRRAADWWGGLSDTAQGNYMDFGGGLLKGIGTSVISGMNAEDERDWEEKMYERMWRDRQIKPLGVDAAPSPRIASGYNAYPAWIQERLKRST